MKDDDCGNLARVTLAKAWNRAGKPELVLPASLSVPIDLFGVAKIVTFPTQSQFGAVICIDTNRKRFVQEVAVPVLAAHKHRPLRCGPNMTNGGGHIADAVADTAVVGIVRRRTVDTERVVQ